MARNIIAPPNPRPEDWHRDLQRIKETGLEVIRVWLYWIRVNPRPGQWKWDDYDRIFALAEENGLKVLLQLFPEAAPYWFQEIYPHTCFVDKAGNPIEFAANPAVAIGGDPGPCFHHPEAKDAGEEFMRRSAERYGRRGGLFAYDVWNEISLRECYCDATQARFKVWLEDKYKDIDMLNRKYVRSYTSFSEISIPKRGVYADMFDYAEFFQWQHEDYLRWRTRTIQGGDFNHPCVSHYVGIQPHVWWADVWQCAAIVDRWGTSCYIGDGHASLTPEDVHEDALQFNTIRDSAQGKPWWLAEFTGGSIGGLAGQLRTPAELRLRMLLAFSLGAEAAIFWQWRPEIYGQEASYFGLTGYDGELTSRTEVVREVCQMLKRHKTVFDNLQWPRAQVGLLWDSRDAMYEYYRFYPESSQPVEQGVGWKNFFGFYRALTDAGYCVEILNARLLAESGIPENLRVIFAPGQIFDRRVLSANLKAWAEKGGTLVVGPQYALFDSDTYLNKRVPPPEIAAVFGVKVEQTYYPRVSVIRCERARLLTGIPDTLAGRMLVQAFQVDGAEVLGRWRNNAVFTAKNFGHGRGIMLGSLVGVDYSMEKAPELTRLVDAICVSSGVSPEARSTGGIIARTVRSEKNSVIFLLNPYDSPKEEHIIFPQQLSGPVTDLLTTREMGHISAGKPFQLRLEAKGATVLVCTASPRLEQ